MTTQFDPTTNRVPFGLLTDEEKKTLKNWPHGHEFWYKTWEVDSIWHELNIDEWYRGVVYRGKPAPAEVETKEVLVEVARTALAGRGK